MTEILLTEKTIEGVAYRSSADSKYGSSDSPNFLEFHGMVKKVVPNKAKDQFRSINLTRSSNSLKLYGKRLRSVLYVLVEEAKHYGRYSCRMQTRHGRAEGFIQLKSKGKFKLIHLIIYNLLNGWCILFLTSGGFIFDPFGYEDQRSDQKGAVPSAVVAPHLTPSANIMASHETEFPHIFLSAYSVANSEEVTNYLLCVTATITVLLLGQ